MDDIRHPLLRQLYEYWMRKKGARKLPRRRDIDPTELPADLWPHLMLQDVFVENGVVRFRYRVVGQHFRDQIGRPVVGTFSDLALAPLGSYARYVITLFTDSVLASTPSYSENLYRPIGQRAMTLTRRIVLPLSEDGESVDKVLSGHVFEHPPVGSVEFGAGIDAFQEILRRDLPA